jgi:hypothetical protein
MNNIADSGRPLQIVTTCRAYDLPVFEIAVRKIHLHLPVKSVCVIAPARDCRKMRRRLGGQAQIIPEDEFIPDMNIHQLRRLAMFGFPKNAGWYFQQLLKLQFAFVEPEDDFYLIWDADTIPLRPMRFFDSAGRMLLTKAMEYHAPYFETYRRLFNAEPNREFSFIAQHMPVQKSIVREMLERIGRQTAGNEGWAWKIMRSLPQMNDLHLFSEFETCGHYLKNFHPAQVAFAERTWWRFGSDFTGGKIPSELDLEILAHDYEFVSFEKAARGLRLLAKNILNKIRKDRPPTDPQTVGWPGKPRPETLI